MALIVTSSRRRIVMATLLAFAVAGAVIRYLAPNPSTLRDIGTLLLVLWLPAVGNLIAYLVRRIPRRASRSRSFPDAGAFVPHLQARLEAVELSLPLQRSLAASSAECLLLVGREAYTARLSQPVARALSQPRPQPIQLLHPARALPQFRPGTDFHLLVGSTAVARGRVEETPRGDTEPARLQ
jgi:hypothetical protein